MWDLPSSLQGDRAGLSGIANIDEKKVGFLCRACAWLTSTRLNVRGLARISLYTLFELVWILPAIPNC
jgi:hypothetical protein